MSNPEWLGLRATAREIILRELARDLRAYQTAYDAFDEAVSERLALNRTDLRCLDLLSQHGPMTAGKLADASGLTTGAITFVLDHLESAGYIHRRRDPEDRRRVVIELVLAASQRAWKLHQPLAEDFRARAKRFNLDELAAIKEFLQIARQVYERQAGEVRVSASRHGRVRERTRDRNRARENHRGR